MTIYELFKSINTESFIKEYEKYNNHLADELLDANHRKRKKIHKKVFKQIKESLNEYLNMIPIEPEDKNIIFVIPQLDMDYLNTHLDVFSVKEEELNKDNYDHYSILGVADEKLLGYQVSEVSRQLYNDDEKLATYIFHEMTFLGYFKKDREKEISELKESLDNINKEIENETVLENSKSMEELFKEIGYLDNRTEYQKQFDKDLMTIQFNYSKQFMNRIIHEELNYIED